MSQTFNQGYAVVIGVGDDLPITIDDATAIANVLGDLSRCAYPTDQVRLLTGEKADRIKLVEGLNAATKVSVMSHELGHALLHSGHEYRIHTPGSIKELEAESVAYLVCSHYNIDLGERTFKYIVHHNTATDDIVEEITKSGDRIFKAYELITNIVDSYLSTR